MPAIARLKPESPVRRAALEVVRGEEPESAKPLFAALANPADERWREREVAAWTLGRLDLPPEERDAAGTTLMDVLERVTVEGAGGRFQRTLTRSACTSAATTLFIFLVAAVAGDPYRMLRYPPWPVALVMMFCLITAALVVPMLPVSLTIDAGHTNRVRAAAAAALGHLRIPEAAGALANAAYDSSAAVRAGAVEALHEVLPALGPEHFGLFGAQSIASLGRLLSHPDGQLAARALEAIRHVGTSHALPYVQKLAASGRTVRLQDAAREVLEVLQARAQQEAHSRTLLRPASGVNPQTESLLRPIERPESDPLQILRTSTDPQADRPPA